MATKADAWGVVLGVAGIAIAADAVAKKQTAVDRIASLTHDGHAKDATIRSLRSQVTNEQAIRQNLQATCNEKDGKILALNSRLTMVAGERDAATRRVAELDAEVARLKAPAAT